MLSCAESIVSSLVHKAFEFGFVAERYGDNPVGHSVFVDQAGIVGEGIVNLNNFA
jgi:hypothetical protein